MTKKILIIIIVVLIPIYIISFPSKTNFIMSKDITKPIYVTYNDTKLKLDDYVYHVVAAEIPISFNEEAIKAQILATRTFTYNKIYTNPDYVFDSNDQAFNTEEEIQKKWSINYENYKNKLLNLIISTKDEIITYENKPIKAYYFSMSNGYTSDVLSVFGTNEEYLKSVPSIENNVPNYQVTSYYKETDIASKLNTTTPLIIENINRDSSNRVTTITINNHKYKGTEIRKILGLRSTDFNISISNDYVTIITTGYGHGVGMSQYGANELAKTGSSYQEIIKKYYTNTEIKKINE
ncbi:MAG: SpoIID/LytB domain-containing protein [Bacilli bacterium]